MAAAAAAMLREPLVPSPSVLRFLRSQVDDICFFTQYSPRGQIAARKAKPFIERTRREGSWGVDTGVSGTYRLKKLESSLLSLGPRSGNLSQRPGCSASKAAVFSNSKSFTKSPHRTQLRQASWAHRLIGVRQKAKEAASHDADEYPPIPNDQGTPILGRTKPANELKLRCTEFDESGNVTLVNGEFKKQQLIAMYGLLPRDLRKIDSSMLPHILVRESAILINLLNLRVLIKHDRVLVFDVYGSTDSYSQSIFMYDLEHKLRQKENPRIAGSLPYEFRALEAVLISVTSSLEQEFEQVRVPVTQVLRELEEDIDREKLRHLLIHSKRISTFEQRARLVRDAIDNLLEEDDDLSTMYLTETSQSKPRAENDHTEVEMLLESYHKVCDEIVQASSNLVSNIRNTEEIVKAILDANRNALMLLDLKFSIGTLGIGSGAFIAALYGMNLKNFLEESSMGFAGITGMAFVFSLVVVAYGLTKLRRVQQISMWGEQGRRNRGSWRDLDPMPALPGETGRQRWLRLHEARKRAKRRNEADNFDRGEKSEK